MNVFQKTLSLAGKINRFAGSPAAPLAGIAVHLVFVSTMVATGFAGLISFSAISLLWKLTKYAAKGLTERVPAPSSKVSIEIEDDSGRQPLTLRLSQDDLIELIKRARINEEPYE